MRTGKYSFTKKSTVNEYPVPPHWTHLPAAGGPSTAHWRMAIIWSPPPHYSLTIKMKKSNQTIS